MSWSAEGQSAGVGDITFSPATAAPSVNLASNVVDSDSEDSEEDSEDRPEQDASRREQLVEYRRTHGTCMYYPTDDRHPCQMQRSCFDCLNYNITTEPNGCFVNPMGQCVSVNEYNPAMDFQLGSPSNDMAAEFVTAGYNGTSGNSSEPNSIEEQQNQQYNFLASEATYLFVIYRIRSRGESSASDGSSSHSANNRRGSNDDDGGVVITPDPGASPIATATPVMRAGSGSGLLLNLFGWTAMRDVLTQKEHLQAAGVEDAALEPVKNNTVQLIGAQPSAPDAEGALPTAPPVIPYATLAMASAPVAITVRAMAAPSAPYFEDMDMDMDSVDGDDVDMAKL
ncbi:hypothetical protein JM18_008291 [Phytophthora kernoviae]|uniref:Uncharacterized protein n=2 Tax=Phytophthora kernoviae TaxID=325452 RepID=A0A921SB04_9STRA|nr:hypothetical protein G195_010146 [Phytophthora kernoviae 00238/432]KAG2514602.1 hypothetical protein JM18_008291 [Phytophthora kernoviae]